MIELKNVKKRFDGAPALDGLTLTVPRGSVYGMVGPNGAGKSTAIRHISGILRPDSGEVLVGGEPVYENTGVKARMAYIPDDVHFLPQTCVNDMRRFYERMYPSFDAAVFEKLRDAFDIDPKQPIRRLSRGMQKQAAFWLALPMRPDRLILDEPMDGLDPVMRRQIWSIVMGDVAENGTTVLVSSHNLRELEDVCDHVGIMNRGKMLLERDLGELQESITKLQVVLPEGAALPDGLDILHETDSGRMKTLIVRGGRREITERLSCASPVYLDAVPLTLEEIFIYELGGVSYEVKDILL